MHEAISRYLEGVVAEHVESNRVDRRYRRAEDWVKWSSHDWRGRRLGEDPQLADVLNNRRVAILGEPGSGKSTAAHSAVEVAKATDGQKLRGMVETLRAR